MVNPPVPDPINSRNAGVSSKNRRGPVAEAVPSKLDRAIEIGLALAIALPPFVFGGREAYGQLALACVVLATFSLWIIRRIGRGPRLIPLWRPEILLVLVAFGLSLASWVPLPAGLVRTLSPGVGRLLPGWSEGTLGQVGAGGWHYFSLTPGLSIEGALLFVLYALLFWITLDTVCTAESARRLLAVLFVTGVGVASVGILHYLFWNGKFYGLWELWWVDPERHVRAPFTNRNHFAGFLALTVAPGVVTTLALFRRWKTTSSFAGAAHAAFRRPHELMVFLSGLGLIVILAGILLSQSRGGTMVGVLALAAVTLGLFRDGFNRGSSLGVVALLVLGGLGLVITFAREDPFQRSAAMLDGKDSLEDLSNQRLRLWLADLHAVLDFPLLGSGVGSHAYVYPLYLEKAQGVTFTHAENCYVQILVECGLAGCALLILAICFLSAWCLRSLRAESRSRGRAGAAAALAVSVSLLAAMIHGVVDFVWYVPAYAGAMAVLAGLACSLYRNRAISAAKPERQSLPASTPWLGAWAWGCGLVVCWLSLSVVVGRHFGNGARAEYAWNAYFRLIPDAEQKGATPDNVPMVQQRADLLAETCRHGSADPDHYYRLGLANLELFLQKRSQAKDSFSLAEARTILQAKESQRPAEARAWLEELYGPDLALLRTSQANFRRSLECCPLNGQAYVRLAELCFLDDALPSNPESYCQEALLVRPHDADVHLQVGLEAWVKGDLSTASKCWGNACRWQPDSKWKLLPLVAEQLPPAEAADFIPLDFEGLKWLTQKESELGRTDGLVHVIDLARKAVEADPVRSKSPSTWLALHELYRDAQLDPGADACLRQALLLAPAELGYHLHLIRWLMAHDRWDEALDQAQKARRSCSQSVELQNLLHDILLMKRPPSAGGDAKKPNQATTLHTGSNPP
jgi:O-antigen ligase/tetratricopeptide (TPR) repeat protein